MHIKCLTAIWLKFHRNFNCLYKPEARTKKVELEFIVNFQYSSISLTLKSDTEICNILHLYPD